MTLRGSSIRWALAMTLGVAAASVAVACGSAKLPAPRFVAHPTAALQPVPYPAPPAQVERVPERPADDVVWIDGEWIWRTRHWVWRPGRWVKPPAGARFSPWTSVRDENGTLFVAAGTWRGSNGEEIAEPGLAVIAEDAVGPVVPRVEPQSSPLDASADETL